MYSKYSTDLIYIIFWIQNSYIYKFNIHNLICINFFKFHTENFHNLQTSTILQKNFQLFVLHCDTYKEMKSSVTFSLQKKKLLKRPEETVEIIVSTWDKRSYLEERFLVQEQFVIMTVYSTKIIERSAFFETYIYSKRERAIWLSNIKVNCVRPHTYTRTFWFSFYFSRATAAFASSRVLRHSQ